MILLPFTESTLLARSTCLLVFYALSIDGFRAFMNLSPIVIQLKSLLKLTFALMLINAFSISGVASGGTITYVKPSNATDSNPNWPSGTAYTNNSGIAFTTGSSGPFDIDWVDLGLNTSNVTSGSASLTVALRSTNNSTPYSAVAGGTEYARDTVSFLMPPATYQYFNVNLTSLDLPNITSYSLLSNTSYALILYAPSQNIALGRTTGFANGTTNNFYTVTNGFTMLDTFRNNSPNYTNNTDSYPTFAISFGANTAAAVPEPSVLGIAGLVAGGGLFRRLRKRFRRG